MLKHVTIPVFAMVRAGRFERVALPAALQLGLILSILGLLPAYECELYSSGSVEGREGREAWDGL